MKFKHWLIVMFLLVGILFIWHNYQSHGGFAGIKSGLGVG